MNGPGVPTGPALLLARWTRDATREQMDPAVREKAVLCLLDALGLSLDAAEHPAVRAADAIAVGLRDDQPGATVWPTGRRVPVGDAALANGIAAHAHFQDDTDMDAWAHPGSLIVPAALALAELRGRDLGAAVRGVTAGYAALNWLGADGDVGHALVERGFRASPCLGTIAAAVAAATVLDLDVDRAHSAVGLAADVTGGLLEPVRSGAQDWRWQNGGAAARGVTAGLLADAGLVGPADPLTGACGFLPTFTGLAAPPGWETPPRPEALHRVWFKPYPLLGDNMAAAVTAALLHPLVRDELTEIHRVEVHINAHYAAYPGTARRGPFATPEQATASTAFAVAVLLARGDLDHPGLIAGMTDPMVQVLAELVRVVPEPDYGYLDATVTVHTGTGTHTRYSAQAPPERFHRDRAEARRAFERALSSTPFTEKWAMLPDALFDWLDGAPPPSLALVCGAGEVAS